MNIRKHWKRLLFSATALFWASCSGDSDNFPLVPNNNGSETPSSSSIESPTSGSEAPPASSANITESSSSEAPSSSSATISSSSSSAKLYKLASDTTVTCTQGDFASNGKCLLYESYGSRRSGPSSFELREMLIKNKTRTLEELNALEDTLEATPDDSYALDYGVPNCVRNEVKYSFKCSNDKSYIVHDPAENSFIIKDTSHHRGEYIRNDYEIYSLEEYFKKFVSSSSSAPESSSSSVEPPSPLCTKNDFVNYDKIFNTYSDAKESIIDSVKATLSGDELESKTDCLNKVHINYNHFMGVVASKQICDGDTIVNPRYQAKLDSNAADIHKQVNDCL